MAGEKVRIVGRQLLSAFRLFPKPGGKGTDSTV
jgi:hypothetical protein